VVLSEDRRQRIDAVGYDYTSAPKCRAITCNLCAGERFVTITHSDRYGFPLTASTCLRCGLTFQNPMLTEEACAHFYSEVYRPLVSAYHGRRINAETIEADQREYAAKLGDLLEPQLNGRDPKTLLDMGGSTGIVAAALSRRFNLRATVCDPSPEEAARARARGLETVAGTAETYAPEGRSFDLILLCQTVDHLLDVSGSLANLRRLLSPGGLLFMDIVDFRAAYLRDWSVEGAIKVDHPYYLTEATAEAFLAGGRLELVAKSYAADHLHVGYTCEAGEPPSAVHDPRSVRRLLDEIRLVQTTPAAR
jgi:SAM-dependent methyltransferase